MQVEICNHCYRYSRLLAYQLSSFVLYPPPPGIIYTLFYTEEDSRTVEVVKYFLPLLPRVMHIVLRPLIPSLLFNRGIGRNTALQTSDADWIWFTDTDILFRRDCLWRLAEALESTQQDLVHPAHIMHSRAHIVGDATIDAMKAPSVRDVSEDMFEERRISRAFGPVQIARVMSCKALGYCQDLRPAHSWWKCGTDVQFRAQVSKKGRIHVPHVYRIRHTAKGRFEHVDL